MTLFPIFVSNHHPFSPKNRWFLLVRLDFSENDQVYIISAAELWTSSLAPMFGATTGNNTVQVKGKKPGVMETDKHIKTVEIEKEGELQWDSQKIQTKER